ncbi:MAG: type II toxin-antitoxin system Phd/YefM family antitoxin [Kineosporiaceae bacterium]
MTDVASRELRNDTAGVLRRVGAGEDVTITANGRPVARLVPVRPSGRRWLTRGEFLSRLAQADPGMRRDLREVAGETTDDLGDPWATGPST